MRAIPWLQKFGFDFPGLADKIVTSGNSVNIHVRKVFAEFGGGEERRNLRSDTAICTQFISTHPLRNSAQGHSRDNNTCAIVFSLLKVFRTKQSDEAPPYSRKP